MTASFQGSLLDLGEELYPGSSEKFTTRRPLSHGAWVDVRPGWLAGAVGTGGTGGTGGLFGRLMDQVPWRAERRQMYDRVVDVPRLLCFYGEEEPLPDPALEVARRALNAHYSAELGERFVTAGLCLYRDGRDSVAWHGDTIGRGSSADTMVAIVSLGAPRVLALRPRGGGPALRYELGHGDLIVMGGSCQRTWEHAVPKMARTLGPRISVQFRPRGVQ